MREKDRVVRALLVSAAFLLLADTGVAGNGIVPWNGWESLRLKARKLLFFTGKIEMDLREQPDKLLLETRTYARFMGVELTRTRSLTTIDRATGRTLEYRSFSRKTGRHYVFGESGYTVRKLAATNGFEAPLEDWGITSEQSYEYPRLDGSDRAPPVYDYHGMILQLRNEELHREGDEVELYVATSKGVQAYRIRVGETRSSWRSFRDLRNHKKHRVFVRELRLRVSPADPEQADEGFLDMEGDAELWVESGTRTLTEIGGKIPKVPGRISISIDSIG